MAHDAFPPPSTSAAAIAATVKTDEPRPRDRGPAGISAHTAALAEIVGHLHDAGVRRDLHPMEVQRAAETIHPQHLDEAIAKLREARPGWFRRPDRETGARSAERLTEQYRSGRTAPRLGGPH
ncbi:MAG: hypothetical protein L0K86_17160 [Actinomycetia bacterium]|nr:hypothetical protein [Actinomycetes bacterium]